MLRRRQPSLPSLALFACFGAIVLRATSVDVAQAEEPNYKRMPWHLIDIWWDTGEDVAFESYSIDVDIRYDVPETVKLYIAPIGIVYLNKIQFYGGLQTQSYAWSKGKYTYKVVKMDEEQVGEKWCTWVGAFVYSHEKDENVFIGALRFTSSDLVLSRRLASFVEIYGRAIPVEQIPRVDVVFDNLRVNGRAIESPKATAMYPAGVPDYAEASHFDSGVLIEVGKPVENRTQRRVKISGD